MLYNCSLMYKIINNLAPSPLKKLVSSHTENIRQTREVIVEHRVTDFGHSVFSVRAINSWNNLPINTTVSYFGTV